jgi:hypothetical protein
MKGGSCDGRVKKRSAICLWNIVCIAIDICQGAAVLENTKGDAGHAFGDGDGSQATAILVFVYCFISIIYVLNGRKVTRRILSRLVKMKI